MRPLLLSTTHGTTVLLLVLLLVQVSEVPPRSTHPEKQQSRWLLYRAILQSPQISAVTTGEEDQKTDEVKGHSKYVRLIYGARGHYCCILGKPARGA